MWRSAMSPIVPSPITGGGRTPRPRPNPAASAQRSRPASRCCGRRPAAAPPPGGPEKPEEPRLPPPPPLKSKTYCARGDTGMQTLGKKTGHASPKRRHRHCAPYSRSCRARNPKVEYTLWKKAQAAQALRLTTEHTSPKEDSVEREALKSNTTCARISP